MNLNNGIVSIEINSLGAELKSAIKNGREYMWCGDEKYWARTSPVLFPIVGKLKDKKYSLLEKEYSLEQHGFARDREFTLEEQTETSLTYTLASDEETFKSYPFDFTFKIKYTLEGSKLIIGWYVTNDGDDTMYFSIGAHPAFNLKDGKNYFKFDTDKDIMYSHIDENGMLIENDDHPLTCTDGYTEADLHLFDSDALIIENCQAKEVSLCDENKEAYVTVRFTAPLFGLWSPTGKNAPFICIEPWYGRCDGQSFCGDFTEKDYMMSLESKKNFEAIYEIEFI